MEDSSCYDMKYVYDTYTEYSEVWDEDTGEVLSVLLYGSGVSVEYVYTEYDDKVRLLRELAKTRLSAGGTL